MEHDSSRSGYHEPEPGIAGPQNDLDLEDDWGDDFPKTFSINLIWAQANDREGRPGAIGFQGGMPWHLHEDLRRFKELTVSHPVIMGRKTWESLGKPLSNRDNIVISHDRAFRAPGATVACDVEEALDLARQEAIPDDGLDRSEIWVIGGAQLFEQMLPMASKVYVTQIDANVDADTYAPSLPEESWQVAGQSAWMVPERDEGIPRYRYLTLVPRHEEGDR
ncbi:dihydrofolate reductase [Bifidobacterium cuniculi]|uniref:dihydrofolate reductase n=1 Tax=Bifidobacterium cuniculi TaxID=1688 RepID=A0A087B2S8_9BIFI|nr:dihydrofolate reductase [Bifidobacterium cuniculi]KFI65328.1 dihydrofolate reductase [Bifidobacterium cuniculi]